MNLANILVFVAMLAIQYANSMCLIAADWPQWRGPGRDAVSADRGLLQTWPSGGPKLAWKATGLGVGYASVVVGDGRLFTLGGRESHISIIALDVATGKELWTRKIGESTRNVNSAPTIDEDRVYALDPDGDLVCMKAESGDVVWQRRYVEDFDSKMMSGRGCGESPLIDGERLICTPGNRDAALVALNKFTGDVIWKAKIPELGPAGRDGAGFSSIVVTEAAGVRQYVQLIGRGLVGIEAETGRYLWGYNAIANENANIPTPIVHNDFVFAANGYTAGSVLLKLVRMPDSIGKEIQVDATVVYSLSGSQFQNHHGGIIRVGDYVYAGHGNNNGLPTCLELETGRILWKRRGPGVGSAAIVYVDGQLIFRYQNGLVALIAASPEGYQLNGTFELPGAGGDSWTHPVVANGILYLREQNDLWAYDLRQDRKSTSVENGKTAASDSKSQSEMLREQGVDVVSIHSDDDRATMRRVFQIDLPIEPAGLHYVTITDQGISGDGLIGQSALAQFSNLKGSLILNLEGTKVSDRSVASLQPLNIIGLNLELCGQLTDVVCDHLKQFNHLTALILSETKITQTGLARLATLRNLSGLELELCEGINDDGCEILGSMQGLRWLNLKKSGFEKRAISNSGLKQLARLTHLEVLNLYGNKVNDEGLVHLRQLKKLRELDLSLLDLNDAGIVALKPLETLERLNLMFTEGFAGPTLSDAACESLVPLLRLRWLNLNGSKLTDAGLRRLQSLKQLKSLQLIRTSVTAEGVAEFQAALPECEIAK